MPRCFSPFTLFDYLYRQDTFFQRFLKLRLLKFLIFISIKEYSSGFNVGFVLYTGENIDEYQKGNFKKQVEFVKGVTKTLKDDGDDTKVGIITYSDKPYLKHRFDDNTTHAVFGTVLDNLNVTGKGRNIGKALELAKTELFNRSDEHGNNKGPDILVVLTDDGSDDDLAVPSFALKRDNVTIFSVGVGRYLRGQLNEMASEPNSEHVVTIDSYDGLGPTMASLKDAIIKGNKITLVTSLMVYVHCSKHLRPFSVSSFYFPFYFWHLAAGVEFCFQGGVGRGICIWKGWDSISCTFDQI